MLLKAVYLLLKINLSKASYYSVACHHQANHLSRVHSLETFSYLSTLERSSHRLADHKHCVHREACVACNVNRASYKTRHIDVDCNCSMVSTPYSDLTKIIRDGGSHSSQLNAIGIQIRDTSYGSALVLRQFNI